MTSAANPGLPDPGHGDRLRDARNQAGLTVDAVASKMRVPIRVVESLEAGDWGRLGAPVFVRGQIRSYARALGLPGEALLPDEAQRPVEPSRLEPRTYTSPVQRFAEQAARRLVYVVITAAIAVPVWVVTRQHVDGGVQSLASLDVDPADLAPPDGAERHPDSRPSPAQQQRRPFVASMAPSVQRAPQAAAMPEAQQPAGSALTLAFRDESWMQIIAPDGSELEQGLLRAGESRTYEAGQVGRVVLGNAGAVDVRRGGEVQDTSAFQRANVARFRVSSDGSLAPVSD